MFVKKWCIKIRQVVCGPKRLRVGSVESHTVAWDPPPPNCLCLDSLRERFWDTTAETLQAAAASFGTCRTIAFRRKCDFC
jgi:hypothetical protein